MSLAVQCLTHGVELVTAVGILPGCLKLWDPVECPLLTWGTETLTASHNCIAAEAMGDRETPGQMGFWSWYHLSPLLVSLQNVLLSSECTQHSPGQADEDEAILVCVGVGGYPASTDLNKDVQQVGTRLSAVRWSQA